jgi:hypothetical protein
LKLNKVSLHGVTLDDNNQNGKMVVQDLQAYNLFAWKQPAMNSN